MSTIDPLVWAAIREVLVGLGVLALGLGVGIGVYRLCTGIAAVLVRLNTTLDEVDRTIAGVSIPIAETLSHVGGIADTADTTIARLGVIVAQLETVAASVAKTATLANDAVTPSIVNIGSALTGVTAGLRRLARGKSAEDVVRDGY